MSRRDTERLEDILAAAEALTAHLLRGDITDGLIFDAVRVHLIEIGEAVATLDPALTTQEPTVAWGDIKGMRNHLAHRYFDTGGPPRVAPPSRNRSAPDPEVQVRS